MGEDTLNRNVRRALTMNDSLARTIRSLVFRDLRLTREEGQTTHSRALEASPFPEVVTDAVHSTWVTWVAATSNRRAHTFKKAHEVN